jgi:chorismate synthase
MSTSEGLGRDPRAMGYRYASTRNFRGGRSFSARETVIATTSGITSTIAARVAAGLGREKPACQF